MTDRFEDAAGRPMPVPVEAIVPGGVLATDAWHVDTNDGTCSRCGRLVPDDEVPIRLMGRDGHDMLIYCGECLDFTPSPGRSSPESTDPPDSPAG